MDHKEFWRIADTLNHGDDVLVQRDLDYVHSARIHKKSPDDIYLCNEVDSGEGPDDGDLLGYSVAFRVSRSSEGTTAYGTGRIKSFSPVSSITKPKTFMSNLKEKFALLMKKEPQRSFQKAGITNAQDELTPEGVELYTAWRFKKDEDEFKKEVVDPILAEDKKANK